MWVITKDGIRKGDYSIAIDASPKLKQQIVHGLNLTDLNETPSNASVVDDSELAVIKFGVLSCLKQKPDNPFYMDFLRVIERAEKVS